MPGLGSATRTADRCWGQHCHSCGLPAGSAALSGLGRAGGRVWGAQRGTGISCRAGPGWCGRCRLPAGHSRSRSSSRCRVPAAHLHCSVNSFDAGTDVSQKDRQNSSGALRCPEPTRCRQTLQNALSIQRKPPCLFQCVPDCSCSSRSSRGTAESCRILLPCCSPRQRSGTIRAAQQNGSAGDSPESSLSPWNLFL